MTRAIDIAPPLGALARALPCGPLYLVGGGVRDPLLGLCAGDYDIAGPVPPETLCAAAKAAGYCASVRSSRMGTVEIALFDKCIEYTAFREESYPPGGGHHPDRVRFTDSLERDALRRDFTVNALYADLATGQILDPLGGLAHLSQKQLVACRSNAVDTLRDDGLRLLRLARFAGELGFSVRADLLDAARAYAGQINAISRPRIWAELSKIMCADARYGVPGGHAAALAVLDATGVLYALIPALQEGDGVLQSQTYHAHDVLRHNLATFAASDPDPVLRWAALLHDVGKPRALDESGRMIGHDTLGAAMAADILRSLGADNRTVSAVCDLIARHMFDLSGDARVNTVRKRFARWGFGFARRLIALRRYDVAGSGRPLFGVDTAARWETILSDMQREGCIDQLSALAISGADIMRVCQLPPGKPVGRLKQLLFDQCAIDPRLNTRETLLRLAPQAARQLSH